MPDAGQPGPALLIRAEDLPAWRERIRADALLRRTADYVVDAADRLLDADLIPYEMTGRRLFWPPWKLTNLTARLGIAFLLTGDRRYAERAAAELENFAGFSDWNPSHFLDPATIAGSFGLALDWMGGAFTEAQRSRFRAAIIGEALEPSFDESFNWWVGAGNNWNQVCHTGLSLAALAMRAEEPAWAERVVDRAAANIPRAMRAYAPDGIFPEGPGYWEYATSYTALFITACENALGTDFGLADSPGFLASGAYYLHVHGNGGDFFNYSDAPPRRDVAPVMAWMAAKNDDPSLLWFESQKLARRLVRREAPLDYRDRFFPLYLLWAREAETVPQPTAQARIGGGKKPVAMLRSGWQADDTFVGLCGGSAHIAHAHMDAGGFVLEMDGVRWACEDPAHDYHTYESAGLKIWNSAPDSDRWRVLRFNNRGHNTLVVDDRLHEVEGFAPLFSLPDHDHPAAEVRLDAVYAGQLRAARRTLHLEDRTRVRIRDEVTAPAQAVRLRWAFLTAADFEVLDPRTLRLQQDGRALHVHLKTGPTEGWQTIAPPPGDPWERPTEGYRLVGFTTEVEANAEQTFEIHFFLPS